MHIFVCQVGKLGPQQLFKVFLRDGGHLDDCKAGSQGLVQLPGARVAIVHGGDEAGLLGQRDALVAGHINGAAEVQHGVEDGQGLVFGHVDLVQYAEAAGLRALVDGALPQRHGAVFKGVRPQQGGGGVSGDHIKSRERQKGDDEHGDKQRQNFPRRVSHDCHLPSGSAASKRPLFITYFV